MAVSSGFLRTVLVLVVAGPALACGGGSSPTTPSGPPSNPNPQFTEASFRRAALITAQAQIAARAAARPGVFEGEIVSVIEGAFAAGGSGPRAFDHIVATGPNTVFVHYFTAGSGRQIADGDLLTIDIGATYDQHCADVTRTFPVSGQFTDRQRELYRLVMDVQKTIVAEARTGATNLGALHYRARDLFRASPLRAKDANGVEQTMEKFFIHLIGHYVGREVHGGDTAWSTNLPLAAHQVLAIEPGVYIPSEGIGLRIEDTYLVTTQGLECLSCAAPNETLSMSSAPLRSLFTKPAGSPD